jgi:hypothetical protein
VKNARSVEVVPRGSDVTGFRWGLLLSTLGVFAPALALAGPPYTTDDPEPVELHHWEIYVATMDQWASGGGWSGTAPHLDVNYGLLPGVQAHVTAAVAWQKPPGGAAEFGYGDTEVGVKVRLVREGPGFLR